MLLNDPLPMACKNRANMWCSTSRSFTCTLKLFEIKSLYMFVPEEINTKLKRHSFCLSTTKSYQQSLLITHVPSVKMYIDIVLALRFQFFCPYVSLDIFLKLTDSGSDRCFGKYICSRKELIDSCWVVAGDAYHWHKSLSVCGWFNPKAKLEVYSNIGSDIDPAAYGIEPPHISKSSASFFINICKKTVGDLDASVDFKLIHDLTHVSILWLQAFRPRAVTYSSLWWHMTSLM